MFDQFFSDKTCQHILKNTQFKLDFGPPKTCGCQNSSSVHCFYNQQNEPMDSPLSSQQLPHVVSQQNSPQLAQSQCIRGGCAGFRMQCGAVQHHTALPLTRGLQVLCGSSCQDGPEGCGPIHPHPQPLAHDLPASHREDPTATEGQDPGHHCWWDLDKLKEMIRDSYTHTHGPKYVRVCKMSNT